MFSVVVPVWNARATLRDCVDRVLGQTFAEFELILVDDGSTDDGFAALADVEDSRLRILRQQNGGAAAARNAGLEAATASWIAFLDADDIWSRSHLEELDRIRQRHPEAGLIGTRFVHSDPAGGFELPDEGPGQIGLIRFFASYARGEAPFWISSSAVARRAWRSVGGFRASANGDDSEFLARVALDFPVAASTRTTAVWIHGTGGITDRSQRRWEGAELRSAADIAPAVATVLQRRARVGPEAMPPGIDAFVSRYVRWCLESSFAIGDVRTLRQLGRLFERPVTSAERLVLALALLPRPLFALLRRIGSAVPAGLRRRLFQAKAPTARIR